MFLDVRMSSEPTARLAELLVLPVLVAAAPLYLCDIRCSVAGQARVTDRGEHSKPKEWQSLEVLLVLQCSIRQPRVGVYISADEKTGHKNGRPTGSKAYSRDPGCAVRASVCFPFAVAVARSGDSKFY